jgi:hypothetical protein
MRQTSKFAAAVGSMLILCLAALAGRIERIDLFDRSDNSLLFVTFDYDSTGKNIGRSVFASDSTFLRSTSFVTSAGVITRENSIDFDGSPVFSTALSTQGGKTAFTVTDQFGLDQLGGAMSYTASSANNFDISQNNQVVYKEQYVFDANGALLRINVTDNAGALQYYGLVSGPTPLLPPPGQKGALFAPELAARGGRLMLSLALSSESRVLVELFTPLGRRARVVLDKAVAAGAHAVAIDALDARVATLGHGAYIVRLSINGLPCMTKKIIVEQ